MLNTVKLYQTYMIYSHIQPCLLFLKRLIEHYFIFYQTQIQPKVWRKTKSSGRRRKKERATNSTCLHSHAMQHTRQQRTGTICYCYTVETTTFMTVGDRQSFFH